MPTAENSLRRVMRRKSWWMKTFLDAAGDGEFCFVENADVSGCVERIEEIYLYRWNRDYPAEVYFPVDLSVWKCMETKEFAGSSHEKITRERYTR